MQRPIPADLAADGYIVIGLATCFIKEDGEVHEVQVLEPIPSPLWKRSLKVSPPPTS